MIFIECGSNGRILHVEQPPTLKPLSKVMYSRLK